MEVIRDFNIIADKESILRAVSSYYDLSDINLDKTYFDLNELAQKAVKPLGVFEIDKMPAFINSSLLKSCENIIYSVFTIGDEITDETDKLFAANEFEKGLILDAISTSILFNISKQLYDRIFEFCSSRKLGLTCRIAPGDGEIDISFQKDIVLKLSNNNDVKFGLVNDYIVKPFKSLTYVFGADSSIKINKKDHSCHTCGNLNCFMRNSSQSIRGPFDLEREYDFDII